jgi:hypothetical protein
MTDNNTSKTFTLTYERKDRLRQWHRVLSKQIGQQYGICATVFNDVVTDVNVLHALPTIFGVTLQDKGGKKDTKVTTYIRNGAEFTPTGIKDEELIASNRKQYYKFHRMVFNFVLNHLDINSQAVVMSDVDYHNIEQEGNIYKLWKVIEKTHTVIRIGNDKSSMLVKRKFYNLLQRDNESLHMFNMRFKDMLLELIDCGITIPSEEAVQQYILAITDKRLQLTRNNYLNNANNVDIPDNIMDIMNVFSTELDNYTYTSHRQHVPQHHKPRTLLATTGNNNGDKLCFSFCKTGKCKHGTRCKYTHDKTICRKFYTSGKCPRGDKCQFKHVSSSTFAKGKNSPDGNSATTLLTSTGSGNNASNCNANDNTSGNSIPAQATASVDPLRCSFVVFLASISDRHHVILDSGSDESIVNRLDVLSNVSQLAVPITVTDFGGNSTVTITHRGYLGSIPSYYSADAIANVVSINSLENLPGITLTYDSAHRTFNVYDSAGTSTPLYSFVKKDRFYVCPFDDIIRGSYGNHNIAENPHAYLALSKEERKRVELVQQIHKQLGHPSNPVLKDIVRHHVITNLPITVRDIDNCETICNECIIGKMINKPAITSTTTPAYNVGEVLHGDIFTIDNQQYLLLVDEKSGLIMTNKLVNSGKPQVLSAISSDIAQLRSYRHDPKHIYLDNQSSFISAEESLNHQGIVIHFCPVEGHIRRAERAIRSVKERVHAILAGLPYQLPACLLSELILYVAQSLNMVVNSNNNYISPREMVTGTKLDFQHDLRVSFGDFVVVRTPYPQQNPELPPGQYAIITGRKLNSHGMVYVYLLQQRTVLSTATYKHASLTRDLISHINTQYSPYVNVQTLHVMGVNDNTNQNDNDDNNNIGDNTDVNEYDNVDHDTYDNNEDTDTNESATDRDDNESIADDNAMYNVEAIITHRGNPQRPRTLRFLVKWEGYNQDENTWETYYNLRHNLILHAYLRQHHLSNLVPPEYRNNATMFTAFTKSAKQFVDPTARIKAIKAELQQLVDLEAFHPVHADDVTEEKNCIIIPAHMLTKDKFNADGSFDKTKSRLVADGKYIDRGLFPDRGSPTASINSIMAIIADACINKRKLYTHDVKSFFIKSDIDKSKGNRTIIIMPKHSAEVLMGMCPEYSKYVRDDGTIYCELDKQLYGTLEAAKAAYEDLRKLLISNGFSQCVRDPCLFKKSVNGDLLKVSVFVDDLLVSCDDANSNEYLKQLLVSRYREIVSHEAENGILNYLRMRIDMSKPSWRITQPDNVNKMLEKFEINDDNSRGVMYPYIPNYDPNVDGERIDPKKFLSLLSSLRYIAQRTRPDILMALGLAGPHSHDPRQHHYNFLQHVAKHVNNTKDDGITFNPCDNPSLVCFADSSFAIHRDGKSHTGIVIQYGGNTILTVCKKHTAISRCSAEAEIHALNHASTELMYMKDIMQFILDKSIDAVMFQDNKSVIGLITRSYTPRSRHLNVKYEYVKELIDTNCMKVVYCNTKDMLADLLTKPLFGMLYKSLCDKIMGNIYV